MKKILSVSLLTASILAGGTGIIHAEEQPAQEQKLNQTPEYQELQSLLTIKKDLNEKLKAQTSQNKAMWESVRSGVSEEVRAAVKNVMQEIKPIRETNKALTVQLKEAKAAKDKAKVADLKAAIEANHVPARGEIAEVSESVYSMAQELDRFHEIQRQFLQNASHEFKTPLMSIQGYAEGIRDGIFADDAAHKGLDVIVSETNRIKHIVTEITLLAKLESEEDLFHPATHSAADLVNRAVERLHPIKLQQNIAIAIRTYGEDGIVYVDDDKILQALLNLIANGLRHATEQIEIKIESGKRFVTIEIIDDGDGIPEDLLPHLFHRFVKGKNGDVGLGLAITRAIIERSGGTIEVKNGVFTGAIFRITLPLQQPGSHI